MDTSFDVGGVRLARPFRIRRLGHFGVNVSEPERSKDFYCRLLGFRISDPLDFGPRLPEELRSRVGPTVGYFARHGTDHHSFVFFPRGAYSALNEWAKKPQGVINQITWQVGSLREISVRKLYGYQVWLAAVGARYVTAGRSSTGTIARMSCGVAFRPWSRMATVGLWPRGVPAVRIGWPSCGFIS